LLPAVGFAGMVLTVTLVDAEGDTQMPEVTTTE
jgi:hypothetical protein